MERYISADADAAGGAMIPIRSFRMRPAAARIGRGTRAAPSSAVMALAVVALAVVALATGPRQASALTTAEDRGPPVPGERAGAAVALAANQGSFSAALEILARTPDPTAVKLVKWLAIFNDGAQMGFADITRFARENPDWPSQARLARQAEEAAGAAPSDPAVIAWFKERPPRTVRAGARLIDALAAVGQHEAAAREIRRVWIETDMSYRDMRQFHAKHGRALRASDHDARMERLLWEGRDEQARPMLAYLEADRRALADARLRLQAMGPGVDRAIDHVPAKLRNDPGLAFDRAKWRRRKGREAEAFAIMRALRVPPAFAENAWPERALLARKALLMGEISDAYRIASQHGLSQGLAHAEALWLSGWIALRYLNDHREAGAQFATMYDAVRTPISRARAAYWAGRAAETARDRAAATAWYARAAAHVTTFYGQLAAEKLPEGERPHMPSTASAAKARAADEAAPANEELARAARLLAQADRPDLARLFLARLVALGKTTEEKRAAVRIAKDVGALDLVVATAKEAIRHDSPFLVEAYPSIDLASGRLERALMLAVTRQESGFDTAALSPAGARGLMQLMPGTAKMVARKLGLDHADRRLVTDPQYNVRLGTTYLADQVEGFGGHYVLALAAYNAGPARVRSWIGELGDPRARGVDLVDWIESIPFSETRNYVQRVVEGLRVYRVLTGDATQVAEAFDSGQGR